jgi:hypothetical protein
VDPKKHRTEEVQHVTNLWKQQEGTIKIQLLAKTHGYIQNIEKTGLILFEPNDENFKWLVIVIAIIFIQSITVVYNITTGLWGVVVPKFN